MSTNTNSVDLLVKEQSQPLPSIQGGEANREKRGRFTIKSVSKDSGGATSAVESKPPELSSSTPQDLVKEKDLVKSKIKEQTEPVTGLQPSSTINAPTTTGNEEPKATDEGKVKKKSRFTVKAVPIQEDESNMTANLQAINPPLTAQQPPLQPSVSTNHPGTGTKPSQHSDNSNISVRPPSVVPPVDGGGNSSIDYSKMEKLLELNYQMLSQVNELMRSSGQSRSNSLPAPPSQPFIPPLNSLASVSQPGSSTPLIIAPTPSRGSLYNRSNSNNVPSRPSSSQGKDDKTPTEPPTSSNFSTANNNSSSSSNLKQIDQNNPSSSSNMNSGSTSKLPSSHSANPPQTASTTTNPEEKDKGYGKMSYYLNELRKELEHERSSKRDKAIELQRLRERCQQYEELYRIEQQKALQFQDNYERIQTHYKQLEQSYLEQQLLLHQANQKIDEFTTKSGVVIPTNEVPPSSSSAAPVYPHISSNSNHHHPSMMIETTSAIIAPSGMASSTVSPNHQSNCSAPLATNSSSHRGSLTKTDDSIMRKEEVANIPPNKLVHKLSARDLYESHSSNASSPGYGTPMTSMTTGSSANTSMKHSLPVGSTPSGKTAYAPLVEGNILNDNVNLFVHINDTTNAAPSASTASNPLHYQQNNSGHQYYHHNVSSGPGTASNSASNTNHSTPVSYRGSVSTLSASGMAPTNSAVVTSGNSSMTGAMHHSHNTSASSLASYSHSSSSNALHTISQRD